MTSDLDIYRAANELIEQHGDEAPIHAAKRADEMLEAGDMDGKAVWLRILNAVDKLLARKQPEGAQVHLPQAYCLSGFAPNRRQPRLLRAGQTWRAEIMTDFDKASRGDVVAPSL